MISLVLAAAAQEPVDFDRAVRIALESGVDPAAARLVLEAARADERARARAWDPSLTAGAGAYGSLGVDPDGGSPTAGADLSLSSSAPLWTGGELRARLDAARAGALAADADLAGARQDVVLAVATALLAVEDARGTLRVRDAALAAEEATLTRVTALVDAGARTRADLDQQRAAVGAARAERIAAELALTEADLDAALLLRLDPSRAWRFVAPPAGPPPPPSVEVALEAAWARRPEVRASAARREAAEASREATRAGLRPSLDASASVVGDLDPGVTGRVGVDLVVPLLDRGVTRGAVAVADAAVAEAELREAEARERVRAEVLRAWARRRSAEAALDAATLRREAADSALAVVVDRYEAGAALLVEVSAARASAVEAARAEVAARVGRVRAEFELAWATGGLDAGG